MRVGRVHGVVSSCSRALLRFTAQRGRCCACCCCCCWCCDHVTELFTSKFNDWTPRAGANGVKLNSKPRGRTASYIVGASDRTRAEATPPACPAARPAVTTTDRRPTRGSGSSRRPTVCTALDWTALGVSAAGRSA